MDVLRQAMMYVLLVAAFYGVVLAMKALSRVQVPSGYTDVANLADYGSYRLDQTVTFSAWKPGDALCWRLGPEDERAVNFGWVAALPGDRVQVHEGHLEVNGQRNPKGDLIELPDCGPVRVPAGHLFVINDRHQGEQSGGRTPTGLGTAWTIGIAAMNQLIEQWGARNLGIAMLVIAGLVLIAAVFIAWDAVQRGMGILALDRAQACALSNDRNATVANGREASSWLPAEAAAGLLAIDLTDPAAGTVLERLELRAPIKQRPTVAAIRALHQIHHGNRPGGNLAAGDQAVITHLLTLAPGVVPAQLTLPDADPPQAPLLAYAAQARFRAAWQSGDAAAIRATAGELRLLMPKHPDAASIEAVLMTYSPEIKDEVLRSRFNAMPRGARRDLLMYKLLELAPNRAAAIRPLLPAAGGGK